MPDKRREELWCRDCGHYVQFMLDYDLDGCYLLNCPNCGREHYRVIENGRITNKRWGQDPRQAAQAASAALILVSGTTMSSSTYSMDTYDDDSSSSTAHILFNNWR